jgi:hypothetical protein
MGNIVGLLFVGNQRLRKEAVACSQVSAQHFVARVQRLAAIPCAVHAIDSDISRGKQVANRHHIATVDCGILGTHHACLSAKSFSPWNIETNESKAITRRAWSAKFQQADYALDVSAPSRYIALPTTSRWSCHVHTSAVLGATTTAVSLYGWQQLRIPGKQPPLSREASFSNNIVATLIQEYPFGYYKLAASPVDPRAEDHYRKFQLVEPQPHLQPQAQLHQVPPPQTCHSLATYPSVNDPWRTAPLTASSFDQSIQPHVTTTAHSNGQEHYTTFGDNQSLQSRKAYLSSVAQADEQMFAQHQISIYPQTIMDFANFQ